MGIKLSPASCNILTNTLARQRDYDGEVWKNRDLAEAAGVHERTVNRCLKGENVSKKTIAAIAQALGVSDRIPELQPQTATKPNTPNLAPTNLSRYRRAVPKFVGRDRAMKKLTELVEQYETVAVSGMGGLGKTELAWQWAQKQYGLGRFPGGVVWLDMAVGNPGEQLVLFCQTEFEVELPELLTLEERVHYCWRKWPTWCEGAVLVVLDDVVRGKDGEKLKILQPGSDVFRVVWTTRDRWTVIEHCPVDQLSNDEAKDLLASYWGRTAKARLEAEPEAVAELLAWFEGLPLGLELAARYLALDAFLPIADYVEQLSLTHESLAQKPEEMRYPHGVEAALALSWARLESDEAKRLAMSLSLFGAAPIPLSAEWQKNWREPLRQLVNLSLLKRETRDRVQLHSLVRQFLRVRLEVECSTPVASQLRRDIGKMILMQGKRIPVRLTGVQMQIFGLWLPHLKEAILALSQWLENEDVIRLLIAICHYYLEQGLYASVEPWSKQCLEAAQEQLRNQSKLTATDFSNLAEVYRLQGKYIEAELLCRKALDIESGSSGYSYPHGLATLNSNLALSLTSLGRYEEAESYSRIAVKLHEKSLIENHFLLALHLNNLALSLGSQKKYGEAEIYSRRAVENALKCLNDSRPYLIGILSTLASWLKLQGKYKEAELSYHEALNILSDEDLNPKHPDIAILLNNLANLLNVQEKYCEAEPLHLEALERMWESPGEKHPDTKKVLNSTVRFYHKALAAGHPETRLNQHPLGNLIRAQL